MYHLHSLIQTYLSYCENQKRLDAKTLKAYRIDLQQFADQADTEVIFEINSYILENYIASLHNQYQPKTVKRKIATLKAFFHFLEYRELISTNPFNRLQIHFREPLNLPKTIPLNTLEILLSTIYAQWKNAPTPYQRQNALRDAAVIELLFSTGMRISELCALQINDINLYDGTILIHGKGSKERRLQIGNDAVINILQAYRAEFNNKIHNNHNFFINQNGSPLSDQTIRRILNKYCTLSTIDMHITPHMFRHTFATSLLEADVDIRYIQEMLGHSSINITEIYTHVTVAKQRDILATKHPRKNFKI